MEDKYATIKSDDEWYCDICFSYHRKSNYGMSILKVDEIEIVMSVSRWVNLLERLQEQKTASSAS